MMHPNGVYDAKIEGQTLKLYAPCVPIHNMGCTLGGGTITLEISSPLKNVIKVKAYHHKGAVNHGPEFLVADYQPEVEIQTEGAEYTYRSGDTSLHIGKGNYNFYMKFYHGDRLLTSSMNKALGHVTATAGEKFLFASDTTYMKEELTLDVGELVYGLGERFTAFVKNGQTVDIWNDDGGTGSDQSYKNIPFYVTNKGYGVFVNQPDRVSFEVASEKVSRVEFSVPGESLEYYVIGGADLKEVLSNYTTLTGKPSLPPAWSFGLWLSTSFVTNYDEKTVNEFIDGMIERDIPLDVFHFDCCWMEEFEWCNFQWKASTFPNPKEMLRKIHEKGIKVCVWINPYIGQKSPLFDEGMKNGYFLKRPNGNVWQWDMWQDGMALVDFTNPAACKWYQSKLEALIDMGVDAFKTDFGERIPTDVVYFDGSDPQKMHNYYTELYNNTVFELLERRLGKDQAVLFARSATAGGQKYPVHWGGDCVSTYPSMAESLRGGLSFTLSGFGFWSHDIGGFEDGCQPDLYKRWTQFGLLSTHSRYHGSGQYKVPWLYDEEAVAVTRKFTKLKVSLMPYLFTNACETAQTGVPMMRAMVLEFPQDDTCGYLDRQFMLGSNLLVAPIFSEDGTAKYYLPEGKWTNFLSGEVRCGGKWYTEQFDYMHMPLMARENSILVIGCCDCKAVYDYTESITANIFELADGCSTQTDIYTQDGNKAARVSAVRSGNTVTVSASGLSGESKAVLWYDGRKTEAALVNGETKILL